MKYITFERVIFGVILITALIFLKRCGGDLDTYKERIRLSDSLRNSAENAAIDQHRQKWEYQNDAQVAESRTKVAIKQRDSIQRIVIQHSRQIRDLNALFREPWPVDTARIGTECCSLAVQLAEQYESLQLVDSLKDGAYMSQIDLATVRIDTLQNQLDRSDRRFWAMDSLNRVVVRGSKVRAKIALGVAGGVTPGISWAGGSVMYSGPGGTSIGADVGLSNAGGMYYGGRVLRVISLRKKR